jgi:hypothetical protein
MDLGFTTLRNRVLMGSMHVGLEEAANGFERMAAFYAERARGGVGLIVTGGIAPNEAGRPRLRRQRSPPRMGQPDFEQPALLLDPGDGGVELPEVHLGMFTRASPSSIRRRATYRETVTSDSTASCSATSRCPTHRAVCRCASNIRDDTPPHQQPRSRPRPGARIHAETGARWGQIRRPHSRRSPLAGSVNAASRDQPNPVRKPCKPGDISDTEFGHSKPGTGSLDWISTGGPGRTRTDDTRGVNASPSCFCVFLVVLSSIFAGHRAAPCCPVRLRTAAAKPSVHALCTPQDRYSHVPLPGH